MIYHLALLALVATYDFTLDIKGYADIISQPACTDELCSTCFEIKGKQICLKCKDDYTLFNPKSDGACWAPESRQISGFGRDCVECGIGNYPDTKGVCHPCPYKCKTCSLKLGSNLPTCDLCKADIGGTAGYILLEDCSCKYGLNVEKDGIVGGCFCNSLSQFTYEYDNKIACITCTMCSRNFDNCEESLKKIQCPQYQYDPTTCTASDCTQINIASLDSHAILDDTCCQDCHQTCDYCSGPGEEDCIGCKSTLAEAFEWVESQKKCFCVCHSKESIDLATGKISCICDEGREMVDVCDEANLSRAANEGAIIDCASEHPAKFQCLCKAGYELSLEKDANGSLKCLKLE